jgi:hypothetical protein
LERQKTLNSAGLSEQENNELSELIHGSDDLLGKRKAASKVAEDVKLEAILNEQLQRKQ